MLTVTATQYMSGRLHYYGSRTCRLVYSDKLGLCVSVTACNEGCYSCDDGTRCTACTGPYRPVPAGADAPYDCQSKPPYYMLKLLRNEHTFYTLTWRLLTGCLQGWGPRGLASTLWTPRGQHFVALALASTMSSSNTSLAVCLSVGWYRGEDTVCIGMQNTC